MRFALQLLALYFFTCITNINANILDGIHSYSVYDYVVIGGGGAGLVMANRLSEDPSKKVLVLHRGFDDVCVTCDQTTGNTPPGGGTSILNDNLGEKRNGASYFSTPQLFTGRTVREVRTNLPGGGTRLYGAVAIPSTKKLIDSTWPISYETLRPYINKWQDHFCNYLPQSLTGITPADCTKYHGQAGGPMSLSPPNRSGPDYPILNDFFAAAPQFGVNVVPDPFNPNYQNGSYVFPKHAFHNRANNYDVNSTRTRESTYTGYTPQSLRASRPNLDFEFGAEARELVYSSDLFGLVNIQFLLGLPIYPRNERNPRVIGVQYQVPGDQKKIVFAKKHVVLSGGVEGTPKFLQYNGIGPADLLAQVGIPLVAENKAIGQNIAAHAANSIVFKTKQPIYVSPQNNGENFIMLLSSPWSQGWPDIEVEVTSGYIVKSFDTALTGIDQAYYTDGNALGEYPYISCFVEVVNPTPRGSVNITSNKWEEFTRVEYGWPKGFDYASSPDFQKTEWGFNKMREIFTGNNSFARKYIDSENAPGLKSNPTDQITSDMFYAAFNQHSIYHTTGGVALGVATDNNGLLKGLNGLSVCDNSLLPHAPSGNPTATMISLCEYVADKIKTY